MLQGFFLFIFFSVSYNPKMQIFRTEKAKSKYFRITTLFLIYIYKNNYHFLSFTFVQSKALGPPPFSGDESRFLFYAVAVATRRLVFLLRRRWPNKAQTQKPNRSIRFQIKDRFFSKLDIGPVVCSSKTQNIVVVSGHLDVEEKFGI